MTGIQKEQLIIFSLFLMADGEKTSEEEEKFGSVCKEMGIGKKDRKEIERCCQEALYLDESDDNSAQIRQLIKALDSGKNPFSSSDSPLLSSYKLDDLKRDKKEQLITLWNLLNFAYSDKDYSAPERKIINFLCELWDVDKSAFNELNDSAETLFSLYSQKAWIDANRTDAVYGNSNGFLSSHSAGEFAKGSEKVSTISADGAKVSDTEDAQAGKKADAPTYNKARYVTSRNEIFPIREEETEKDIHRVIESIKIVIEENS